MEIPSTCTNISSSYADRIRATDDADRIHTIGDEFASILSQIDGDSAKAAEIGVTFCIPTCCVTKEVLAENPSSDADGLFDLIPNGRDVPVATKDVPRFFFLVERAAGFTPSRNGNVTTDGNTTTDVPPHMDSIRASDDELESIRSQIGAPTATGPSIGAPGTSANDTANGSSVNIPSYIDRIRVSDDDFIAILSQLDGDNSKAAEIGVTFCVPTACVRKDVLESRPSSAADDLFDLFPNGRNVAVAPRDVPRFFRLLERAASVTAHRPGQNDDGRINTPSYVNRIIASDGEFKSILSQIDADHAMAPKIGVTFCVPAESIQKDVLATNPERASDGLFDLFPNGRNVPVATKGVPRFFRLLERVVKNTNVLSTATMDIEVPSASSNDAVNGSSVKTPRGAVNGVDTPQGSTGDVNTLSSYADRIRNSDDDFIAILSQIDEDSAKAAEIGVAFCIPTVCVGKSFLAANPSSDADGLFDLIPNGRNVPVTQRDVTRFFLLVEGAAAV